MLAITQAEAALGDWRLSDCTLYVTKEPCAMCAGAMVLARLKRIVYGVRDEKGGAGSLFNIVQNQRLNHRAEVHAGVRADECLRLLQDFFQLQRARPDHRK
jgi:tRNA(adenine34) deaminase